MTDQLSFLTIVKAAFIVDSPQLEFAEAEHAEN